MEHLLQKTDFSDFGNNFPQNSWAAILQKNAEKIDFEPYLALVGAEENHANAVRREFFKLKKGAAEKYHLADAGNILPDSAGEVSDERVFEVCATLLNSGIVPVLIGLPRKNIFAAYSAFSKWLKQGKIALFEKEILAEDEEHLLNKIYHSSLPKPFNIFLGGYQEYLCDRALLNTFSDDYFELQSVGKMRTNFSENEILIRDAEMFIFNANVLANPFGLTGEEAAQLSWYAGMNENMSFFALSDFPDSTQANKTAAVMLWYFLEGAHQSFCERPTRGGNFEQFIIPIDRFAHDCIELVRSKKSNRWWYVFLKNKTEYFIPASRSHYEAAVAGDIPENWWRAHNRVFFGVV
jgi:formiminoglutamase